MYDIVFISFNEPTANDNYRKLASSVLTLDNFIHRVDGVRGIHLAHIEAAKLATTKMFWVVDADAEILPTFKFKIKLDPSEEDIVHVQSLCLFKDSRKVELFFEDFDKSSNSGIVWDIKTVV